MQGFPSSESDSGPFSPEDVQGLIRIEYARAARYGYPITLMAIEVDRLDALHDLYGVESERRALAAVVHGVRSALRQSDFLGLLRGRRILVLCPHAPGRAVSAIATRILENCHGLEFRSDGRSVRPTLSIGASTLHPGEGLAFEPFLAAAEQALAFAVRAGGDHFVLRQTAGSALGELRRELEREEAALRGAPSAREPGPDPAAPLEARIRALFRALGEHSAQLGELEQEVLRAAGEGFEPPREQDPSRVARQVATLARRIRRLKALLDATEAELAALARRKGVDPGVASIFRTVQGLRSGQEDFSRRHGILTLIFEANLDLRREREDPA